MVKLRSNKSTSTPRRQANPQSGSKFVSYHASRQAQDTPKTTNRLNLRSKMPAVPKMVRDPARLPIILIGLVILVCVFYSTTLTGEGKLVITKPAGVPQLRSTSDYQDAINDLLGQSILNRNKISINTSKLTAQMLDNFPELDTVNVVLPMMGHRPVIEVTTARPALTVASQGGVFIVDSSGKAIAAKKDLPDGTVLNIPTVREEADLDLRVGRAVLSKQDVTFITTVSKQLSAKRLEVESFILPPLAAELHVNLKDTEYYIKMSLLTDPKLAAGQYIAFHKNKIDKGDIRPKDYVDVRVEERVYYK